MRKNYALVVGAVYALVVGGVLTVFLVAPGAVLADVTDNFDDLHFSRFDKYDGDDPNYDPHGAGYDPNNWDPNNPDWSIDDYVGLAFSADANSGMLRLYVQGGPLPFGFIGAECDDGNLPSEPNWLNYTGDAKTMSTTFFDDSDAHYVIARAQVAAYPFLGMTGVWMNFNHITWHAYAYEYEPANGWTSITAYAGTNYDGHVTDKRFWCVVELEYAFPDLDPNNGDANYFDPNRPADANYVTNPLTVWFPNGINYDFPDPNDPNRWVPNEPDYFYNDDFDPVHPDPNGFYMLLQFDPYGLNQNAGGIIDANDPNCHWLRAAFWTDGEEWNGEFHLQCSLVNTSWDDPNDQWYIPAGTTAFASFTGGDPYELGPYSDVAYDNFESKWGYYKTRTLTITMKDCCDLTISPDRLDDPNGDPNDPSELRRFSISAPIVLDAVTPCGNKSFKKWRIYGPNGPGDPAYQEVNDTNAVLYLTMNGDYEVKAVCKCGGGGLEPFAGIVLLALGLGVMIRRLS